jgi:hypothetical protein
MILGLLGVVVCLIACSSSLKDGLGSGDSDLSGGSGSYGYGGYGDGDYGGYGGYGYHGYGSYD